ncbi:putative disease resistance protein [Acorus calamus]|uniref:Disease resistance protein n=1 Tax=Acorus calamus TaxID=4465 RepID=A0AAV9C0T1_ACOCL|nr:putative disease resistance protein [Acorus calamus]
MMAKLKALKLRINNNVNMAERRGQRRHDQVDLWLNGVQSLEVEVNSIIERHQKRSIFCYLNIWLNWTLGQKAAHILEEVKNHITRGEEFRDNVSHAVESMIDTKRFVIPTRKEVKNGLNHPMQNLLARDQEMREPHN